MLNNAARTLALTLLVAITSVGGGTVPPDRANEIKFFQDRVERDPDDIVAENRFADLCLEKLWQTGDFAWLKRARKAATQSLASVPAERNPAGLPEMTRVEYESHQFGAARDLALQLSKLDPGKSRSFALLGDAWLELGDITRAADAYAEMQKLRSDPLEAEPRLARLALARGQLDEAAAHSVKAVDAARDVSPQRPDLVAWALVQIGQLAFARGDWSTAENEYNAALQAQPNYAHALEHLGELRAAQEKYDEAISLFEKAIAVTPRPEFAQGLGDVYAAAGRGEEAAHFHQSARDAFLKSAAEGNAHYFHHLAGYYSDVEENPPEAVKWARRDLEIRHTAAAHDALAWALYRSADLPAAAVETRAAIASGTQDAHILFHAGMICLGAGETAKGRELLANAARVNPRHMAFHVHR